MKANIQKIDGAVVVELEAESRDEGDMLLGTDGFAGQQLTRGTRYFQKIGGELDGKVVGYGGLRIAPRRA